MISCTPEGVEALLLTIIFTLLIAFGVFIFRITRLEQLLHQQGTQRCPHGDGRDDDSPDGKAPQA